MTEIENALTAIFTTLQHMLGSLCWHPTLSLLPLIGGILLYRFELSKSVPGAVALFIGSLVPLYIGVTGIGAAIDVGDIFEPKFFFALLLGMFIELVGYLVTKVCFSGIIKDDEEYIDSLEHIIDGRQAMSPKEG